MLQPHEMPQDLASCQALALDLAAKCETLRTTLTAQVAALQKQLAERADEYEKMRKLLSHFINGRRSEKVVLPTPDRSTLANLIDSVEFVIRPLIEHMTRQVQHDTAVGLDDTSCRLLLPRTEPTIAPGDERSVRLAAKVAEANDDRLRFAACWAYARRKVFEAETYSPERETLLGMIQLMKQVAMGRKAWLFVVSEAGGRQSAKMMTLVSSARRHDLDAWVYVKDVFDQLLAGSTDYQSLLPDVWKRTHPEANREYREEERRDKAERKQLTAARRRLARP